MAQQEKNLYIAPEQALTSKPTLFLAGPIQGARDWQRNAIDLIHGVDSRIVITSPRRPVFSDVGFDYDEQVDWETRHLAKAGKEGVVLFWLERETEPIPGRSYAQTTRFELGEWFDRHKKEGASVVVGIDEGFTNARYIRRRLSQEAPEILLFDSLNDTCMTAAEVIKAKPNFT